MKILLVDDDVLLRDMYITKFKELGDEVVGVESADKALQKLKEESFDVLISDMIMPGTTGTELVTKVKSDPAYQTIDCIILSNQSEASDIDAAKKAGVTGYLVKAELIPSEVVTKVHELVKK